MPAFRRNKETSTIDRALLEGTVWLTFHKQHPHISFERFKNRYTYLRSRGEVGTITNVLTRTTSAEISVELEDTEADNALLEASPISEQRAEFVAREQRLREQLSVTRSERSALAKLAASRYSHETTIREALQAMRRLPAITPYTPPSDDNETGCFLLCLHDLHIGQQTYSALGEYDPIQFQDRCRTLTDQVITIIRPYV